MPVSPGTRVYASAAVAAPYMLTPRLRRSASASRDMANPPHAQGRLWARRRTPINLHLPSYEYRQRKVGMPGVALLAGLATLASGAPDEVHLIQPTDEK